MFLAWTDLRDTSFPVNAPARMSTGACATNDPARTTSIPEPHFNASGAKTTNR